MKSLKQITLAFLIAILSGSISTPNANAAAGLLVPPLLGGALAGAAMIGSAGVITHYSGRIKSRPARITAWASASLLAFVGIILLEDRSVQVVLNEFPTEGPALDLLASYGLSRGDAEIYNRERLQYQGVIESLANSSNWATLSIEERSALLASEAGSAGLSPSTIRVAGLVDTVGESQK